MKDASSEKSEKMQMRHNKIRIDALSACLKAGGDTKNLDHVLHPMFEKLKNSLKK